MSGSPRTYPTASSCRPPKSPAAVQVSAGGTGSGSKDFLQPGDTAGLAPASKTNTISSQHRWVLTVSCNMSSSSPNIIAGVRHGGLFWDCGVFENLQLIKLSSDVGDYGSKKSCLWWGLAESAVGMVGLVSMHLAQIWLHSQWKCLNI